MIIKVILFLTLTTIGGLCGSQTNENNLRRYKKRGLAGVGDLGLFSSGIFNGGIAGGNGLSSIDGGSNLLLGGLTSIGSLVGSAASAPTSVSTRQEAVAVPVPQIIPIPVTRARPIAVPQIIPVDVPRPVAVHTAHAVPVTINKPYPVPVDRAVPVSIPKTVPIPVNHPVPVPYNQPYPVTVTKHIPVSVPIPKIIPDLQPVIHSSDFVNSGWNNLDWTAA